MDKPEAKETPRKRKSSSLDWDEYHRYVAEMQAELKEEDAKDSLKAKAQ